MPEVFHIYCDESCHLEHDQSRVMVLGAVWCPRDRAREINQRIREIKIAHGVAPASEIKWTKVSPGGLALYEHVMDYFFDDDDLHFRALVVSDKSKLRHADYRQTHDEWYYKVYFDILKVLLSPSAHYRIFLDIKDTQGGRKVAKLHEVLSNAMYDFSRQIIESIQIVRSDEVNILQLADLLIGTIGYASRGLDTSAAKLALVDRMRSRSGYSLSKTTLYREEKVNLFFWDAKERDE